MTLSNRSYFENILDLKSDSADPSISFQSYLSLLGQTGSEAVRSFQISIDCFLGLPTPNLTNDRVALSVVIDAGHGNFETAIQDSLQRLTAFPIDQLILSSDSDSPLKKWIAYLHKQTEHRFEIQLSDENARAETLDLFAEAENVVPYLLSSDSDRSALFIRDCCQLELAFKLSFPDPVSALSAVAAAVNDASNREILDLLRGETLSNFTHEELENARNYLVAIAVSDPEAAIEAIGR